MSGETILVIDDDTQTRDLIALMLRRQGFTILEAATGKEGLEKATAVPDLILLDLMMPDIDGLEVTRRLRAEKETRTVPIIMFTAKSLMDDKVAGFEAGIDDYLTKPIHPAELAARIKSILAARSDLAS
jgi:pilus assembly protein CpaE